MTWKSYRLTIQNKIKRFADNDPLNTWKGNISLQTYRPILYVHRILLSFISLYNLVFY